MAKMLTIMMARMAAVVTMAMGMAKTALEQFKAARRLNLPKPFKRRAKKFLRWLEDFLEEQGGQQATLAYSAALLKAQAGMPQLQDKLFL